MSPPTLEVLMDRVPTRGNKLMTVAALARAASSSPDAVRHYERVGLLPPPPRSSDGYRRYDESAIDRLHFIQGAQRLGLRLREIGELLNIRDTGVCPCGDAARLMRARLDEINTELTRLTSLHSTLVDMVEQIPSQDCPDPSPGVWKPPAATAS
ncbi:MAG: MerR family transcriptional regulator [Actinophytocola sp.]|uniref:MerR family transcriptional regulator n=1 Tax=Actinophytocola sp. TaxID=1872138 RepID=UPI003D6A8BB3